MRGIAPQNVPLHSHLHLQARTCQGGQVGCVRQTAVSLASFVPHVVVQSVCYRPSFCPSASQTSPPPSPSFSGVLILGLHCRFESQKSFQLDFSPPLLPSPPLQIKGGRQRGRKGVAKGSRRGRGFFFPFLDVFPQKTFSVALFGHFSPKTFSAAPSVPKSGRFR